MKPRGGLEVLEHVLRALSYSLVNTDRMPLSAAAVPVLMLLGVVRAWVSLS